MWLAIWGFFALFIAGFVIWTMLVLHQQKRAWAAFAKKNKLKYEPGTFMGSATVTGKFKKRMLSLYTGIQQTDDIRGQRFVTVIEFQLGKGMPTGAAIATPEFAGFIDGLVFDQSYRPDLAEWKKEYILSTRDEKNLRAYLTKERLQILHSVFSMTGASALFFFDELEAVLRIETSDPLRNEAHLNAVIKRLSDATEKLAPAEAEKTEFARLLEEEKSRRVSPEPPAAPEAMADADDADDTDVSDIDLEELGIAGGDEDDDEEEIIIIKKRRKKKPAAVESGPDAKNARKKPASAKKKL